MGKLMFITMQVESMLNICISISEKLLHLYGDQHEIYILVNNEWEQKLKLLNSQIKFIACCHPNEQLQKEWLAKTGKNKNEVLTKICQNLQLWYSPKKTDMMDTLANFLDNFFTLLLRMHPYVTKIVQDIKPDFIIQGFPFSTPLGIDQKIPYAILLSCSPTMFGGEDLPPLMSDLETEPTIKNKQKWSEFFNRFHLLNHCEIKSKYNNWLKANDCPNLNERMFYLVESPYFNIQMYPQPIDYNVELPGNWVKFQSGVFKIPSPLVIPNKFQNANLEGKLIYINLGCNQVVYSFILDKLLNILQEIKHRFIITADLNNHQLAPNIYASVDINALSALQIADLVIYHGGTKTMCDSFHFSVPGIVMPLYGDQIDNSRRLCDKQLGFRIFPEELSKEGLEDAINKCLDLNFIRKFKEISMSIRKDNGLEAVCNEIAKYLN